MSNRRLRHVEVTVEICLDRAIKSTATERPIPESGQQYCDWASLKSKLGAGSVC